MCHADQHWTEALPLVLLGIRTSFKADLQASIAEFVYGEPSRIPGELLIPNDYPEEPVHLITQLRQHMARLRPVPATRHTNPGTLIHKDLTNCTRLPPRRLNSSGPQSFLQRPLPGLIPERQNSKTSCAWKTHHCVCRKGQTSSYIQ
jgi:hypothetical protein